MKYTKKEAIEYIQENNWTLFTKNRIGYYFRTKKIKIYNTLKARFRVRRSPIRESDIFKEAQKYNKRTDFQKKSGSYYNKAKRLNILNEACSHMKKNNKLGSENPNFKWTKNKLKKKQRNIKVRVSFQKKVQEPLLRQR